MGEGSVEIEPKFDDFDEGDPACCTFCGVAWRPKAQCIVFCCFIIAIIVIVSVVTMEGDESSDLIPTFADEDTVSGDPLADFFFPSDVPSIYETGSPTLSSMPTPSPTAAPTPSPTTYPSATPTASPTAEPTATPSSGPTPETPAPTTLAPTPNPTTTTNPTTFPTSSPSSTPTVSPTMPPTTSPTDLPTWTPTSLPSSTPSVSPTVSPTASPSSSPTDFPTLPLTLEQDGQDLTNPAMPKAQFGHYFSISSFGKRASVGAPMYDGPLGTQSGLIRAYTIEDDGTWYQLGRDYYGGSPDDWFGWNAPISHDGMWMAASGGLGRSAHFPYVRTYRNVNNMWVQKGDDLTGPFGFGTSISLSSDGHRLGVAAKKSVHMYEYDKAEDKWVAMGNAITEPEYAVVSLSGNGDRVAIGGPFADGKHEDGGHVRVFQYDDGDWAKVGDTMFGNEESDQFGYSVSLSLDGTIVAAGSLTGNYAKVFRETSSEWTIYGDELRGGDKDKEKFGFSVSLSGAGRRLIVGSPLFDMNHGRSVIYRYNIQRKWAQILEVIGEKSNDQEGYTVAMSSDGGTAGSSALNGNNGNGRIRIFKLR